MARIRLDPASRRTVERIIQRKENFDQKSPMMYGALMEIGTIVQADARRNLTVSQAVDMGFLRANTGFRIERLYDAYSRVLIGAFGVKYARMVELGGAFTDAQRKAMFAKFREMGRKPKAGKGVIANNRFRARPFLGPALRANRKKITEILRVLATTDATGAT